MQMFREGGYSGNRCFEVLLEKELPVDTAWCANEGDWAPC